MEHQMKLPMKKHQTNTTAQMTSQFLQKIHLWNDQLNKDDYKMF